MTVIRKNRVAREYLLNSPDQIVGNFLQEYWIVLSEFNTLGPRSPMEESDLIWFSIDSTAFSVIIVSGLIKSRKSPLANLAP